MKGSATPPEYADLQGIRTSPLYPAFHDAFPDKLIVSTENAAAVSSRGEYLFPVTSAISAPVRDGRGGDPETKHVSGTSCTQRRSAHRRTRCSVRSMRIRTWRAVSCGADGIISASRHPTTPLAARTSASIDLAGFKKDRFFLYQAHWRPDLPMAHILPHWTWPERVGQVTPVHVFTSGDEGELFLNGQSLGRRRKGRLNTGCDGTTSSTSRDRSR